MELAPIIATIAFIVQKIIEVLQPALEHLSYFRFNIKELSNKIDELDKVYKNTLNSTKAADLIIEDNDFQYKSEMKNLAQLKTKLEVELRSQKAMKVRRYIYLGSILGIICCLIVSKFGGVQFMKLSSDYANCAGSEYFWIFSSICAGLLVGLGSKPVNDILDFLKDSKKKMS